MASAAKQLNACVDACILINFALVLQIEILGQTREFVFWVLDEVLSEITVHEQRRQVYAAIRNGHLQTARIETTEELAAFVAYAEQFGKGESACLAVATGRGWIMAMDETKDRRLVREISARGIEIINTPGIILKLCVTEHSPLSALMRSRMSWRKITSE